MALIIAFAVVAAICTLYLIAPISLSHKRICYILMLVIPAFSLGVYMKAGSPDLSSAPANNEQIEIIKLEKQLANNDKDNIKDIEIISRLAALYMAEDELDKAIALLENTNQNGKDIKLQLATAYFAKGLLFAEQKQKDKALELLQKAYNHSPKDAPFLSDIMIFIDRVRAMDNPA